MKNYRDTTLILVRMVKFMVWPQGKGLARIFALHFSDFKTLEKKVANLEGHKAVLNCKWIWNSKCSHELDFRGNKNVLFIHLLALKAREWFPMQKVIVKFCQNVPQLSNVKINTDWWVKQGHVLWRFTLI